MADNNQPENQQIKQEHHEHHESHQDEFKQPGKIKRFFIECRRVLRVTKKPDSTEFKTIVKVSGIGMIIIGLVGFIIQIAYQLLFK